MDREWIAIICVLTLAAVGAGLAKWRERKDEDAYFERLHSDPEFARKQRAIRANDDWEDLGYFDGR